MARYFFDVRNDGVFIRDETGPALDDVKPLSARLPGRLQKWRRR
jgi:hypothetical protein